LSAESASAEGALFAFTDDNWEQEVLASDLPVAVGFYAEWCVPCRTVSPSLEGSAAGLVGRMRVGCLNVDENPRVTARYKVQGLPTLLVFDRGEPVERRVGLMAREYLFGLLESRAKR